MSQEIGHRRDIDGLRAVAVIAVILFHLDARWLPGGFTGVDVFFVISGYVVTLSLLRRPVAQILPAIRGFYARRLARILPNLLLMLLATVALTILFVPTAWLSNFNEVTARYAFFGLSNIALQRNSDTYFSPITEFNPFTHTWSLGVEEQFYVIAPLLLLLWMVDDRRGRRYNMGMLLMVAGFGISMILAAYLSKHSPKVAFYFIGTRFWELGTGVLLALHASCSMSKDCASVPASPRRPFDRATFESWAGFTLILAGLVLADEKRFPFPWALLPVAGTALLILGCSRNPSALIPGLLSSRPMNWVGLRSYALYLWHWPVIVLLRWTYGIEQPWMIAIAMVTMTLLAAVTFRLVETPAIRLARRQGEGVTMLMHLSLLAVSFAAAVAMFSHKQNWSLSTVTRHQDDWYAEYDSPQSTRADWLCRVRVERESVQGGTITRVLPHRCSISQANHALFVLGDSHTNHYAPMYWRLAASEGVTVTVYSGCTYLNLRSTLASSRDSGCRQFINDATADILAKSRAGDIFMPSSLRIQRYADQWGRADKNDHEATFATTDESAAALVAEAAEHLQAFIGDGMRVLFPAPTPVFKSPAFRCADWFNRSNPVCDQPIHLEASTFTRQRASTMTMISELRHRIPKLETWDPAEVLCPSGNCSAMSGERPLFFDGDHLSAYGNHILFPSFSAAIGSKL